MIAVRSRHLAVSDNASAPSLFEKYVRKGLQLRSSMVYFEFPPIVSNEFACVIRAARLASSGVYKDNISFSSQLVMFISHISPLQIKCELILRLAFTRIVA